MQTILQKKLNWKKGKDNVKTKKYSKDMCI